MFKRANKITALLVAAASVISIVPAMAAEKLGNKDGHIYNAVAFQDGKYLYEGYRTDDDDSALYYNDGGKDKKLDDATTFDSANKKFDSKYSMTFDGSDPYVVDLSTGKVSDEDSATDLRDTATTKLDNKLDKTNRFNKNATVVSTNLKKIDGNKFGDVWYEYTATNTVTGTIYTGYTNASGAYIDCSDDLNAYLLSPTGKTTTGAMVKVENVGDTQDGITATSLDLTTIKTLGQDDKYIYRLVDVNLTGTALNLDGSAQPKVTLLQKIAKAQGDKKDDAYLPKTTDSYVVSSNYNNSDVTNAATALAKVGTGDTQTTIVDGAIYVTYSTTDGKVKTEKLLLRNSEKITATSLGAKVDARVVKKDTDKDNDAEDWSIDVNGNVWAIHEGKILKSTKAGDFTTVYTCDRSMDQLDVYDEKNLIAWEKDSDVYTTVSEGKKQAEDDASAIVQPVPAKVGWDKLADGTWNFYDATGAKVVNNWVNVGGVWYFLKADGAMATGWFNQNGTWYYLKASGAMATGWLNDNGTWYYLNASGAMLANTTVDGYVLGASGAWVK